MHKQRIALIISAAVGVIATFLPFIKSFETISLIQTKDGTGYIIIIAFIISLIISLLGKQQNAIFKGHLTGIVIPGLIPGVLLLLFAISRSNDAFVSSFSSIGIGFYLVIIASLSILISGLALKDNIPYLTATLSNGKPNHLCYEMNEHIKKINYGNEIADSFFQLACCYSTLREKELAYKNLNEALRNGYNNYNFIKNNARLQFLREQPEYIELEKNNFIVSNSQNSSKFCTNCGKQYDAANAGQFCEECGAKL